jgi:VanZ family protein
MATPRIALHPRYGFLTLAYLVAISWLSFLPDAAVRGRDPLVQVASNLFHIPLFAGLTFCVGRTISGKYGNGGTPQKLSALTLLGTGAFAALDEWSQSFIPGRRASLSDFLLDLAGILGVIFILRLQALRQRGS